MLTNCSQYFDHVHFLVLYSAFHRVYHHYHLVKDWVYSSHDMSCKCFHAKAIQKVLLPQEGRCLVGTGELVRHVCFLSTTSTSQCQQSLVAIVALCSSDKFCGLHPCGLGALSVLLSHTQTLTSRSFLCSFFFF